MEKEGEREGGGREEREHERFTTIRFGALIAADLSDERTKFNPDHKSVLTFLAVNLECKFVHHLLSFVGIYWRYL